MVFIGSHQANMSLFGSNIEDIFDRFTNSVIWASYHAPWTFAIAFAWYFQERMIEEFIERVISRPIFRRPLRPLIVKRVARVVWRGDFDADRFLSIANTAVYCLSMAFVHEYLSRLGFLLDPRDLADPASVPFRGAQPTLFAACVHYQFALYGIFILELVCTSFATFNAYYQR
jgi:hypothetical protein